MDLTTIKLIISYLETQKNEYYSDTPININGTEVLGHLAHMCNIKDTDFIRIIGLDNPDVSIVPVSHTSYTNESERYIEDIAIYVHEDVTKSRKFIFRTNLNKSSKDYSYTIHQKQKKVYFDILKLFASYGMTETGAKTYLTRTAKPLGLEFKDYKVSKEES